jgi:hypothetical protein
VSEYGDHCMGTCKPPLKAQYVARRLAMQVAACLKNVLSGQWSPFLLEASVRRRS